MNSCFFSTKADYKFDLEKSNLFGGRIEVIIGPMFAGKTTELKRRLEVYTHAGKKAIIINYFSECAMFSDFNIDGLSSVDVVGIDDGQFFPGLAEFCSKLANSGKIVIVSALNSSFKRELFSTIASLFGKVENIGILTAVCSKCSRDAAFTKRINTTSKELVLIGGREYYTPVCRHCSGGRVEVILGPMFAGKTTEMIRRVETHRSANKKVMIIKYVDENITENDGRLIPTYTCKKLNGLNHLDKFDVVGIDTGHFYPDLDDFSTQLADKGKIVIVSALNTTFQMESFPSVSALLGKVEDIRMLTAICWRCEKDASFTKRVNNESQETVVIGGYDIYRPVCRKCFNGPQSVCPTSNTLPC